MRLLRFELYKLTRNVWPLIFLLGFFLFSLLMFSHEQTLMTWPQFQKRTEGMTLERARINYSSSPDAPMEADSLEEIYANLSKDMFQRVFQKSSSTTFW